MSATWTSILSVFDRVTGGYQLGETLQREARYTPNVFFNVSPIWLEVSAVLVARHLETSDVSVAFG